MKKKPYNKFITFEEGEWLRQRGLHIMRAWINPSEGYDYELYLMGGVHMVYMAKSARACYNYALKNETKFPIRPVMRLVETP